MAKRARAYWLMKTEPEAFSIEDLERKGREAWDGVRNYMVRNYMREMQVGDLVLFYHSNAAPPGVAGVSEIVAEAYAEVVRLLGAHPKQVRAIGAHGQRLRDRKAAEIDVRADHLVREAVGHGVRRHTRHPSSSAGRVREPRPDEAGIVAIAPHTRHHRIGGGIGVVVHGGNGIGRRLDAPNPPPSEPVRGIRPSRCGRLRHLGGYRYHLLCERHRRPCRDRPQLSRCR